MARHPVASQMFLITEITSPPPLMCSMIDCMGSSSPILNSIENSSDSKSPQVGSEKSTSGMTSSICRMTCSGEPKTDCVSSNANAKSNEVVSGSSKSQPSSAGSSRSNCEMSISWMDLNCGETDTRIISQLTVVTS